MLNDGITAVSADQTLSLQELQGLTFLPAANAAGQVSFSFSVSDSGSVGTPAESITETVTIDILNFNDTPILPTDAIKLSDGTEDLAYNFTAGDLLAGVTDPDVDANGVSDVTKLQVIDLTATNGVITGSSATGYTFTPDANFNGIANFNYTIIDTNGGSVSNTIALNIVAVNDAPDATFAVDQVTTEGNNAITGTLTSTDIDTRDAAGDSASFSLLSASINNAAAVTTVPGLTINANGAWAFDPSDDAYNFLAVGETQTIEVTYQVKDAEDQTARNTFFITVNGTNDDPGLSAAAAALDGHEWGLRGSHFGGRNACSYWQRHFRLSLG